MNDTDGTTSSADDGPAGPRGASAVPGTDGSWEATWDEPDGRGGVRRRFKDGFQTETSALAYARRVETALRLNRC